MRSFLINHYLSKKKKKNTKTYQPNAIGLEAISYLKGNQLSLFVNDKVYSYRAAK
jgi:hypothetical protein